MEHDLQNKSSTSKRTSLDPDHIVLGSEVYGKIRGSSAFVDKTMLIKDFVDSGDEVLSITCPRRFGKSSNMNMIKEFLQMKVDDSGNQIKDLENNGNYQIFNQEINNKGLKIMEQRDFVHDHFANHPVIFVNFKDTGKGSTIERIESNIKSAISDAFEEHEYMEEVLRKKINSGNENKKKKQKVTWKNFSKFLQRKDKKQVLWIFKRV